MKNAKRITLVLLLTLLAAAGISVGWNSWTKVNVGSGFAFGPAVAQQEMKVSGEYAVHRWGFPSTYRETQSFRSTQGAPYRTSYESKPFNVVLVTTNIVFWMALFVALLAPVTIIFRRKQSGDILPQSSPGRTDGTERNADSRD